MLTDPVADFLTRIRNASSVGAESVHSPYSKLRQSIAEILHNEGYIGAIKVVEPAPNKKELVIDLEYHVEAGHKGGSHIKSIQRVSKPGRRIYVNHTQIPRPRRGQGMVILSTSSGIITGREAYKRGLGGEILCTVW